MKDSVEPSQEATLQGRLRHEARFVENPELLLASADALDAQGCPYRGARGAAFADRCARCQVRRDEHAWNSSDNAARPGHAFVPPNTTMDAHKIRPCSRLYEHEAHEYSKDRLRFQCPGVQKRA